MPDYQEICEFFYKVRNNLLEEEPEQNSENNFTEEYTQNNNIHTENATEYGYSNRDSGIKYDYENNFDPTHGIQLSKQNNQTPINKIQETQSTIP